MDEQDFLVRRFDEQWETLRAVAFRMLGSSEEAEEAMFQASLRLGGTDAPGRDNLSAWLTTVVGRVCLDMLRSRAARRDDVDDPSAASIDFRLVDPDEEALLADSVAFALLAALDTLDPSERMAFVLHDVFAVPFDEVAPVVDRTPTASRELAQRARQRVRNADLAATGGTASDRSGRRDIVDAFLAASRLGDSEALLKLLDPDVVLRADTAAVESGARGLVRGARAVADVFAGRARAARPALVEGAAALVWAPDGEPQVVFAFTLAADGDRITGIDLLADPDRLAGLDVTLL